MPSNGSVNVPSKSNSTVSNKLTSSLQTYLTYYKKFLRQCQPTGKKCLTNNFQGSIITNENRCGFFLISHLFATQLLAVRRFYMQRRYFLWKTKFYRQSEQEEAFVQQGSRSRRTARRCVGGRNVCSYGRRQAVASHRSR